MVKSVSEITIDREEWDFSHCPKEKVYFCFTYEFAREMTREVPAFLEKFNLAKPKKGNWHSDIMAEPVRVHPNDPCVTDFMEIIDAPPGFPDQPYMKLDHKITDRSYHPFDVGFPFVTNWDPIQPVRFENGTFSKGTLKEELNLDPNRVSMMYIDWSCSPKEITKAFQRWMKTNRPKAFYDRRGHKPEEQYRNILKDLGAYRLMRKLGSMQAAWDYTIKLGVSNSKGLFAYESHWSAANTRTKQLLAKWKSVTAIMCHFQAPKSK